MDSYKKYLNESKFDLLENIKISNDSKLKKILSKYKFGKPEFTKDKYGPFLTISFPIPVGGRGEVISYNDIKTSTGQNIEDAKKEAKNIASEVEKFFKKKFNLEYSDIEDGNRYVNLFMVSNDFQKLK